jgi:hypothetical protein
MVTVMVMVMVMLIVMVMVAHGPFCHVAVCNYVTVRAAWSVVPDAASAFFDVRTPIFTNIIWLFYFDLL